MVLAVRLPATSPMHLHFFQEAIVEFNHRTKETVQRKNCLASSPSKQEVKGGNTVYTLEHSRTRLQFAMVADNDLS
ncbi:hypothetical protein H4Q26_001844 [Puccinia striiformis f. sp. tritici PST-130]|nr:hypothetical protein H4Q26_001844 [Puccinia striiformis f. sp. tritici PST-130]